MTDNLVDIPIQGQNTPQQPASTPVQTTQPVVKLTQNTQSVKPAIPSTEEMEQKLQKEGELLPHLRVEEKEKADVSPLAALQPDNMVQTQNGPQPLNLPSQKKAPLAETELATTHLPASATATAEIWWNQLHRPIKTFVAIGLAGQGLYGIYKSLVFILVTYPQLEAQLATHMITQAQVNGFATHAIIIVFSTVISMFFALRIIRNKATTWINTFIGIGLFLGGTYISSFLSSNFDLITLITTPFYAFTNLLKGTSDTVTNTVPFLDKGSTNEIDVVWYQ